MDDRVAKAAAEGDVLIDRDLLVAEEHDEIVHQGIVDFLELLVSQRLRQVDSGDFRADGRRHLADGDGLVSHCIPLGLWSGQETAGSRRQASAGIRRRTFSSALNTCRALVTMRSV